MVTAAIVITILIACLELPPQSHRSNYKHQQIINKISKISDNWMDFQHMRYVNLVIAFLNQKNNIGDTNHIVKKVMLTF